MNGSVSLVGGHMDYFYECEVCMNDSMIKVLDTPLLNLVREL